MSLDALPSELLSLILQSADSPLDLDHLISAAPSCLQAFSQSPQVILSSVIQNVFPSGTIQHALAVLRAPSSSAQVPSFLDQYFDPASSFSLPMTKDELINLYRLYHRTCYFSDAYFAKTMHKLSQLGQQTPQPEGHDEKQEAPWPSGWALASPSERARLQRAFLRFELYSQIFPGYEHDTERPPHLPIVGYPADQQVALFLDKLLSSEVEQISIVQRYYASLIESFIRDLEDEFVKAVLAAPGVVTSDPSTDGLSLLQKEKHHDENLVGCNTCSFELRNLGFFTGNRTLLFPNYTDYMTSRGVDTLYTIASDERERREVMLSTRSLIQDFLPQALRHGSIFGDLDEALRATLDDIFKEESNFLGYRVLNQDPESGLYMALISPSFRYRNLRDLGYVFWDEGRMLSPEVRGRLAAGQEMEGKEGRRYDWGYRQSPEGRLEGVRLPEGEMERIGREFGSKGVWHTDDYY